LQLHVLGITTSTKSGIKHIQIQSTMKNLVKILVPIIFAVSILACGQKREKSFESGGSAAMMKMDAPSEEAPPPPLPPGNAGAEANSLSATQQPSVDKRKIIKDGTIQIEVDNIPATKKKIEELVKRAGGYISDDSYSDDYGSQNCTLKIRIPSTNFDTLIAAVEKGNKDITSKDITARDVTEEFIDLETRLQTKKNYLQRYTELLKQARSVEDILKIQGNTRALEEEIESTEGRLKYLNDQVSYSSLEISLVVKKDYIAKPIFNGHFFTRLGHAFITGWYGAVEFIIVFFRLWPLWIITIISIYGVSRFRRKRRNWKVKE